MEKYKLSPEAELDLERIWFYGLERWGLDAADDYIKDMYRKFEQISGQPLLYQAVNEIRDGYRRCVVGTDSVFYRVGDESVEIMAVIGQQDLKNWL